MPFGYIDEEDMQFAEQQLTDFVLSSMSDFSLLKEVSTTAVQEVKSVRQMSDARCKMVLLAQVCRYDLHADAH